MKMYKKYRSVKGDFGADYKTVSYTHLDVYKRQVQLIKEDRFYTGAEQDRFDNIDSIAIREALAERGLSLIHI